jgi:hypothetical protein
MRHGSWSGWLMKKKKKKKEKEAEEEEELDYQVLRTRSA